MFNKLMSGKSKSKNNNNTTPSMEEHQQKALSQDEQRRDHNYEFLSRQTGMQFNTELTDGDMDELRQEYDRLSRQESELTKALGKNSINVSLPLHQRVDKLNTELQQMQQKIQTLRDRTGQSFQGVTEAEELQELQNERLQDSRKKRHVKASDLDPQQISQVQEQADKQEKRRGWSPGKVQQEAKKELNSRRSNNNNISDM